MKLLVFWYYSFYCFAVICCVATNIMYTLYTPYTTICTSTVSTQRCNNIKRHCFHFLFYDFVVFKYPSHCVVCYNYIHHVVHYSIVVVSLVAHHNSSIWLQTSCICMHFCCIITQYILLWYTDEYTTLVSDNTCFTSHNSIRCNYVCKHTPL